MDNFASLLIYIATIAVVIDYGSAGIYLYRMAIDTKKDNMDNSTNAFLRGLSDLFFFDVALVSFWPAVLIIDMVIPVSGLVWYIVTAAYLIICTAAIVGRRRWWKRLVEPVVSGGSEDEKW